MPTLPEAQHRPGLDPKFVPAVLWNRHYRQQVDANPCSHDLHLALTRPDGTARTTPIALPGAGDPGDYAPEAFFETSLVEGAAGTAANFEHCRFGGLLGCLLARL